MTDTLVPKASARPPVWRKGGWQRDVVRYGAAAGLVALAAAVRLLLTPIVSDESPYLFFVPAVLAAAGIGGLGPGLTATALSLLLAVLILGTHHPLAGGDVVNAAAFGTIGAGIAWIGESLRQSRVRATASTQDALSREAHMRSILDTIPDAMVVIDERGTMQSFSSAASRLFGYSAGEIVGKNINCCSSPYHFHDGYLDAIRVPASAASSASAVSWWANAGTDRYSMELSVGEMNRNLRFFTGFIRDLTEL